MEIHTSGVAGSIELFVITYNRSADLAKTLEYLSNSILSTFKLTVVDNCSTDDTVEVTQSFASRLPNSNVYTNKYNIGLGANFLKCFELSDSEYTWVLCDDDYVACDNFDDITAAMQKGVPLIHVGAHAVKEWPLGGEIMTPKELLAKGYPYFKFSSFIPCNIFKTDLFTGKFIVPGYRNIVNEYPHMPFLFDLYLNDGSMYISKKQLVVAQPSSSGYSPARWLQWWGGTCELMPTKDGVRKAFLDQWNSMGSINDEHGLMAMSQVKEWVGDTQYIDEFIAKYLTSDDKLKMAKYRLRRTKMVDALASVYRKVKTK